MEIVSKSINRYMSEFENIDNKELLNLILSEIIEVYCSDLSLEGIAERIGFSKIYINRIFKAQFSKTILEVLQIYKIQKSKFYLLTSEKKISEIANSVGYSEAGYFGKIFKKYTQMTPLDFRLKYKDIWDRRKTSESFMAL